MARGFNLINGVTKVVKAAPPSGQINLGAALAPGRGQEAIGGALNQAAEATAGEYIRRSAQARTAGKLVAADTAMIAAETEFETWKQANPDETTWADEWDKRVQSVTQGFKEDKMTLDGRAKMNTKMEAWAGRSASRVKHQEATATNDRARTQFKIGSDDAYKRGAYEVGDAYIDDAVAQGLFSEAEGAKMKTDGRNTADKALIEQTIIDDPKRAVETLEDPDYATSLFPEQRRVLINKAKGAKAKWQGEMIQSFQERILAGEPIKKDEFEFAVEVGYITATQSKYLQDQQSDSVNYGKSLVKALDVQSRMLAFKETGGTEEERQLIANEIGLLDKNHRARLESQWLSVSGGTNKVHAGAQKAIFNKKSTGLLGGLGKYKVGDAPTPAHVGRFRDPVDEERINRIVLEALDSLEKAVALNPEWSLKEQLQYVDDIIAPYEIIPEAIAAEEEGGLGKAVEDALNKTLFSSPVGYLYDVLFPDEEDK